ncbi:MAG: hypothetical protein WAQ28_05905 [Bacteroidia bacterium]|jgi:hypothetical protein
MNTEGMRFSYEELYFMYGQYDSFVQLHFCHDTESYRMFDGNYLMGTFRFTNPERIELEKLRGTEIPRTEKRITFIPSQLHSFSEEINTYLDRDGFLCSDICSVSQVNRERQNRYTAKGEKEIPGTLKINFDGEGFCAEKAHLWLLSQRIKKGWPLIDFEMKDYYGLKLFFSREEVIDVKDIYTNFETLGLLPQVNIRYLKTKFFIDELTEDENKTFQELLSLIGKERVDTLMLEFQKATESMKELKNYADKVKLLYSCLTKFEDETLIAGEFPVWWDFERFLHIYMRHVKETQVGSRNEGRSVFQYAFRNVMRIIKIVLESIESEIVEHFKNSVDVFVRRGRRAVYYDGHYYRVEIESNGRLLTFHPYNDDRERNADN